MLLYIRTGSVVVCAELRNHAMDDLVERRSGKRTAPLRRGRHDLRATRLERTPCVRGRADDRAANSKRRIELADTAAN